LGYKPIVFLPYTRFEGLLHLELISFVNIRYYNMKQEGFLSIQREHFTAGSGLTGDSTDGGFIMRRLAVLLLLVLPAACSLAQPEVVAAPTVQARVVFDQGNFFLGENILAHYTLTNTGDAPVSIDYGGDYRGAPRSLRFTVTATDEQGNAVPDPYVSTSCMGGISWSHKIEPGETLWLSVPLTRYCDFERPGVYTVRVSHDLGWHVSHDLGWQQPPVAEGELTLVMPSSEQAREVVDRMLKLPKDTGGAFGERRQPYADLSALHYPVYLPALEKLARAGSEEAVEGIAYTMTPDAMRLLLELAPTSPAARRALRWRVPDRQKRGFWQAMTLRRTTPEAWDDGLRPLALATGWALLAKPSPEEVADGAHLIACLDGDEELPRLLKEFDRILVDTQNDPVEQNAYLSPLTAGGGALHTLEVLCTHGVPLPAAPQTAAERLFVLCAVKKDPDIRPPGWQAMARELLTHPIPFVRATALKLLPLPLDPAFVPAVKRLMTDSSDRVAGAACELASNCSEPEFSEPALTVLRQTKNEWLVRAAVNAARASGVTRDRWMEICIARLDESDISAIMYEQLLGVISDHGRSQDGAITPASAAKLKASWQAFVEANRAALRGDTQFAPGEPPVTADLLDHGTTLRREDGTDWPERRK